MYYRNCKVKYLFPTQSFMFFHVKEHKLNKKISRVQKSLSATTYSLRIQFIKTIYADAYSRYPFGTLDFV